MMGWPLHAKPPATARAADLYAAPQDRARFLERLRREPERTVFHCRMRRLDGGEFPAELHATLAATADGPQIVGMIRDVGEHHRMLALREDVERIQRHEVKTPVISILAGLELLRSELALDEDHRQLLQAMQDSGRRLLDSVNLSLTLARMEAGDYNPTAYAIDLGAEVAATLERIRRPFAHKNLRILSGLDCGCNISGEPFLVQTMLDNLLKNAMEAAPRGGTVRLDCGVRDGEVRLDITNDGAVHDDMRGRFFDKYATSGKRFGTGLGTYLARLVARAHGGDVAAVFSDADTVVSVRLPAKAPQQEPQVASS
jgi:signal transduction histidine kinase